jgi:hypothetical protein
MRTRGADGTILALNVSEQDRFAVQRSGQHVALGDG